MSEDFKIWWHNEGSGMPPFKEEETCDHVERVSAIAWSNGAFKATLSLEAENARLKAEVERLRNLGIKLDGYVDLLQAENERLRKAGDAVCESPYLWENDPAVIAWRAAKEGKQP